MKKVRDIILAKQLNLILDILNEYPEKKDFELKGAIENWLEDYYKK